MDDEEQRLLQLGVCSEARNIIRALNLFQYYPAKLRMEHIMSVQNENNMPDALNILKRLIMIDYRGRDDASLTIERSRDFDSSNESTFDDEFLADFPEEVELSVPVSPLDVFLVIFSCCHLMLRQTLLQKMHIGKLAVPILYPSLDGEHLQLSAWAISTMIFSSQDGRSAATEVSADTCPMQVVTFCRLGRPNISKSKILNEVLSDKTHGTYFNQDSPRGNIPRILSEGLVEGSWYLPSSKESDIFSDITLFLNLRGNATNHSVQLKQLSQFSSVIVVFIQIDEIEKDHIQQNLVDLHGNANNMLLFSQEKIQTKV